jgi:lipoate-protein ligase A
MQRMGLIFDPPASGPWNMAVDETLLASAWRDGIATLRFYGWEPPTLSLGYFQFVADRKEHPTSRGCPMVRRWTGGGAIVHHHELTYCLTLPAGRPWPAAKDLYAHVHQTLVATLAEWGVPAMLHRDLAPDCRTALEAPARGRQPFLCFLRRACSDVVLAGHKIAGSAQRRRRGAVLQHGSVLLARSPLAPELPGIAELTGLTIAPEELAQRWVRHLAAAFGVTVQPRELTPQEREEAAYWQAERFAPLGTPRADDSTLPEGGR